jgi:hypothetical protein
MATIVGTSRTELTQSVSLFNIDREPAIQRGSQVFFFSVLMSHVFQTERVVS